MISHNYPAHGDAHLPGGTPPPRGSLCNQNGPGSGPGVGDSLAPEVHNPSWPPLRDTFVCVNKIKGPI